ncbi:hypothetical protein [Burkholderia sp. FL-7-2-10-S1-D7]|uniref:hypothetical protein n=1 Tax=Burkholderia sp. FL-7-2-10-S1-D7 TaxID=1637866 RepID=UPI0012E39FCC|nr:hypothetical protein [Burkholderia sp. FL-7-2-10-S1-D7]
MNRRVMFWGLAADFAVVSQASNAANEGADMALRDAVLEYAYDKTPEKLSAIKNLLDKGMKPESKAVFIASYYKAPEALDLLLANRYVAFLAIATEDDFLRQ